MVEDFSFRAGKVDMKTLVLVALAISNFALAGNFGKEADKASVNAKKSLLMVRENPATGDKVLFEAGSVNAKEVQALAKAATNEAEKELVAKFTALEAEREGTPIAHVTEAKDSPTNARWSYYYGSFYVIYYAFYYVPFYFIPWGGFTYYWLW